MRTKNSALNMAVSLGGLFLNVLLQFMKRKIFLSFLSVEYLGVNGLFSEVLSMLSLVELGIGSAMIYSLYKPVADGDTGRIQQLMNLYRILYRIVAIVVLILGTALIPFLGILIKGQPDIQGLTFYYLLFLANSVCSYLLSYKQSIIMANQKAYINSAVFLGGAFVQCILQILVLVLTHNFTLYLLIQIGTSVLINVVLAVKADRMYPFLKENRKMLPGKDERKEIFKNVSAMAVHRAGSVAVHNTDNLLMSAFVGLISVGVYSNYSMIISNLNNALNSVMGAFTAGIGNLGATESDGKVYETYNTLNFFSFLVYGYCAVALITLFNPFISAFFGEQYLLSPATVFLIVLAFYLTGMRQITLKFRDALGIFWYDRYKPVFELAINLVASLIWVKKYGIAGIFAGTVFSTLATSFWVDPYILMRRGIKKEWKSRLAGYFFRYGVYTLSMAVVGGGIYLLCGNVPVSGYSGFFLKAILCTAGYNGIMFLLFARTKEMKRLFVSVRQLLGGKKSA